MNKEQKFQNIAGNGEAGFIKTIALIVVLLIILNFIGIDINGIWDKFIFPILQSGWNILVWLANILYGFLKIFINAFQLIMDFVNTITRG